MQKNAVIIWELSLTATTEFVDTIEINQHPEKNSAVILYDLYSTDWNQQRHDSVNCVYWPAFAISTLWEPSKRPKKKDLLCSGPKQSIYYNTATTQIGHLI